ncbi:MAG TPA: hypothetical protein VMX54_07825 [Vicinamibacteria bacterium]|nr:hypothetical protein [Vicinamibacteria bacterium]
MEEVFIYRKGNGGAFVSKSPAVLKRRGKLRIVNLTECDVEVTFPPGVLAPATGRIDAKKSKLFTVTGARGYYEYDVTLTCRGEGRRVVQRAEANSRPGAIIDP